VFKLPNFKKKELEKEIETVDAVPSPYNSDSYGEKEKVDIVFYYRKPLSENKYIPVLHRNVEFGPSDGYIWASKELQSRFEVHVWRHDDVCGCDTMDEKFMYKYGFDSCRSATFDFELLKNPNIIKQLLSEYLESLHDRQYGTNGYESQIQQLQEKIRQNEILVQRAEGLLAGTTSSVASVDGELNVGG